MRTADRLVPGEVALYDQSLAYTRTRMLGALAEHGVADALGAGPATAEQLAKRLDLHADTLHRVLRALAIYGIVRLDRRGRFRLTHVGHALREDHPHSMKPWIESMNTSATQDAWAAVGRSVNPASPRSLRCTAARSGITSPRIRMRSACSPRRCATSPSGRSRTSRRPTRGRRRERVRRGRRSGHAAGGVLSAHPGLRGVLVEAPGVLAEAEGYLQEKGVRER